jgi:hypothetical protein
MKQLSLDSELYPFTDADPVEKRVTYSRIHVNRATFKAGLVSPAHRWFRLTPSFGPDLVQEMLVALSAEPDSVVLDPFAGVGTTIIESKLKGIQSFGFEINPVLHWVGNTCLNWGIDPKVASDALETISQEYHQLEPSVEIERIGELGVPLPPIHNLFRWWRPDVLKQLLVLKHCLNSISNAELREFFRLALAAVLVPDLTNVTLGKLQLHFVDRSNDKIDVWGTLYKHATLMIEDCKTLRTLRSKPCRIVLQDSSNLNGFDSDNRVDCVITSPPYPNRYSYVWNTRPHLYFFDFLQTPKQASDLDVATIGGTWGTATSSLQKGVVQPINKSVHNAVSSLVESIRRSDNLMANYVMKYFNSLAKQILAMEALLARDARVAYVVGCSEIRGVYVETDVLLGRLFETLELGYTVRNIERFRKRNSGVNLHESIVYAWKRGI